jgi:hypothetical protein
VVLVPSQGWPEGTTWAARPTPRFVDPLRWLDMTCDFPAHRRRRALQTFGYIANRRTASDSSRDVLSLRQGECPQRPPPNCWNNPAVMRQQTMNGCMWLAEGPPNPRQRLPRLPTAPYVGSCPSLNLCTTTTLPSTVLPAAVSLSRSMTGLSPTIPSTMGDWGSANASGGHSTNLVKLKRKPALISCSLSARDGACAVAPPDVTTDVAHRVNARVFSKALTHDEVLENGFVGLLRPRSRCHPFRRAT